MSTTRLRTQTWIEVSENDRSLARHSPHDAVGSRVVNLTHGQTEERATPKTTTRVAGAGTRATRRCMGVPSTKTERALLQESMCVCRRHKNHRCQKTAKDAQKMSRRTKTFIDVRRLKGDSQDAETNPTNPCHCSDGGPEDDSQAPRVGGTGCRRDLFDRSDGGRCCRGPIPPPSPFVQVCFPI